MSTGLGKEDLDQTVEHLGQLTEESSFPFRQVVGWR